MPSLWLVLSAMVFFAISGAPAFLFPKRSAWGQRTAFLLMVTGSVLGSVGVLWDVVGPSGNSVLTVPWTLPWGRFAVALDPLTDFFLALIFLVPTLGAGYGLGYWKQVDHPDNGNRLGLSFGLLTGAMALVAVSRDGILFLLAWEIMALAAFFAITTDDDVPEVRQAGWVYLVATHLGTLCLLAMFILWSKTTGSFSLQTGPAVLDVSSAIFVLALVGFGFKAGLMPLHFWLPGAHANAPSHVSAVLSGVMLKMGIYGILRMTAVLPAGAEWWGIAVLSAGAITGVLGILFALGQQDLKRLLAYSSIENIGISLMGIGLALLGRYHGRVDWILLGLGGALFHIWNHGLFKPLLFFGAGALIHTTKTRVIDQMGGLGKSMPRTLVLFGLGAVAISGLPPLNGFAGEWYLYLGFFHTLQSKVQGSGVALAVAASGLALIGALAVACFVKLTGAIFLGERRKSSEPGHDPAKAMLVPMMGLAGLCLVLGLGSPLVAPALQALALWWAGNPVAPQPLTSLAPSTWISWMGGAMLLLAGGLVLLIRILPRSKEARKVPTWDCGYARPTARMQYSASSLTDSLVQLFGFVLRPRVEQKTIPGRFPRRWSFRFQVPDLVLDRCLMPLSRLIGRHLPAIRIFQQGQTHVYVLSILLVTILFFSFAGFWGRP